MVVRDPFHTNCLVETGEHLANLRCSCCRLYPLRYSDVLMTDETGDIGACSGRIDHDHCLRDFFRLGPIHLTRVKRDLVTLEVLFWVARVCARAPFLGLSFGPEWESLWASPRDFPAACMRESVNPWSLCNGI
jgi:hypothetical protein